MRDCMKVQVEVLGGTLTFETSSEFDAELRARYANITLQQEAVREVAEAAMQNFASMLVLVAGAVNRPAPVVGVLSLLERQLASHIQVLRHHLRR